ncbi:MAG TPA: hypothetical protein PLN69_05865 [bacterium]|nr:hypothetical protein [bacterium]
MRKLLPGIICLMVVFCASVYAETIRIYVPADAKAPVLNGVRVMKEKLKPLGMDIQKFEGYGDVESGDPMIIVTDLSAMPEVKAMRVTDFDRAVKPEVPKGPEAYAVVRKGKVVYAAGSDEVGTMYAIYDITEQLQMMGADADISGVEFRAEKPYMELRAVNPFLQVDAFNDQNSWYYDKEYWETYLDELSWDRYNLLDFHAMYELISTFFPNCYLYLLYSDNYPDLGVGKEQAAKNLEMLNWIVDLALSKGLHTSLMSYHASWKMTSKEQVEEPPTEVLQDYTAEMVKKIIEEVPNLWMVGFRIGESSQPADFFDKSYVKGIKEANRDVFMFTRTWLASSEQVLTIPESYPNRTFLEIKYNGEQLGLPYHAMTSNRRGEAPSYTWESYSNWPRKYKILWQVRANGTHRLFRWGDPDFAARCMKTQTFVSGAGFTMEPMTSYYPPTDFFFKSELSYDFFKWDHQRNWFWYMVWGRNAYNPETPKEVWENRFRQHYGDAADDVLEMMTQMSRIVPLVYSWRCLGPDHRHMAPEYETGGTLKEFMLNFPLDPESIRSIDEYVNHYLYKDDLIQAKLGPFEAADLLDSYADAAIAASDRAKDRINPANKEFQSLHLEMTMLKHLARYYSNKIRAATYLNFYDKKKTYPELQWAKKYAIEAIKEWEMLSEVGEDNFREILDTLRMRRYVDKPTFTWGELKPRLMRDVDILNDADEDFRNMMSNDRYRMIVNHVPTFVSLVGKPMKVSATVIGCDDQTEVFVAYRAKGQESFSKAVMHRDGDSPSFVGDIPASVAYGELEYYIAAQSGGDKGRYPGKQVAQSNSIPTLDIEDYTDGFAKELKKEVKKRLKYEKNKYVNVTFVTEFEPPRIRVENVNVKQQGKKVEVVVAIEDSSPIQQVKMFYKRVPTIYSWQETKMEPIGDGKFSVELSLNEEGMLYYFHASDANYNSAAYPNFLEETPYLLLDSWDPAINPYAE